MTLNVTSLWFWNTCWDRDLITSLEICFSPALPPGIQLSPFKKAIAGIYCRLKHETERWLLEMESLFKLIKYCSWISCHYWSVLMCTIDGLELGRMILEIFSNLNYCMILWVAMVWMGQLLEWMISEVRRKWALFGSLYVGARELSP